MRYISVAGLENRDYGRGDQLRWPRDPLYQLKLALTSPTGCGSSVGLVRLRTKTKEFSLDIFLWQQACPNAYAFSVVICSLNLIYMFDNLI
jgi:hypothetical protein